MNKKVGILTIVSLTGCASLPTDTPPTWQQNSEHYLLAGRQGWMPGQHLSFGDYQIQVEKSSALRLVDDVLLNAKQQTVRLALRDNMGRQATFNYQQKCDGHRGALTFFEPNKFSGQITTANQQGALSDPYDFVFASHRYQLSSGKFNWPQVLEVSRDGQALAELHLGVSDGAWRTQDHIWFAKALSAEDALLAALLAGYAVTYQPDYCDTDDRDS